jgi:sugar phosphate isomerase/epimerase
MDLLVGLNPYGLTYTLGFQGAGTPRANPAPGGWRRFLEIAGEIGARSLELDFKWSLTLSDADRAELHEKLAALRVVPVVSCHPPVGDSVPNGIAFAREIGAKTLRCGLSRVLCGDRALLGPRWPELILQIRRDLKEMAPRAADAGLTLAIEDHQDFGGQELADFATEAGPNVGITFDTGNPLAVGEGVLEFARTVAPLVRHIHLKDYHAQWTDEGYRLVRSAIGDGCVPFKALIATLAEHGAPATLTASLEPGALESRHIRLFTPSWWEGYPDRAARDLAPALSLARCARLPEDADARTPWEKGEEGPILLNYEIEQIRRSAANMRALGWL